MPPSFSNLTILFEYFSCCWLRGQREGVSSSVSRHSRSWSFSLSLSVVHASMMSFSFLYPSLLCIQTISMISLLSQQLNWLLLEQISDTHIPNSFSPIFSSCSSQQSHLNSLQCVARWGFLSHKMLVGRKTVLYTCSLSVVISFLPTIILQIWWYIWFAFCT